MSSRIDITGQRFGRLVALKPTKKRIQNNVVWECRCDCGNVCEVTATRLRQGEKKSCGCIVKKDITGQRFGRLVALEPTDKRSGSSVVWKCKCDCGNVCEVAARDLKDGGVKSCGCLNDISGLRFGKLTAIEPTDIKKRGSVVWKCQCDCGNECEVAAVRLKSGKVKSCGCMRNADKRSELTGKRFGKLTAIEPTDKRSNGSVVWKCQCDCGNVCEVRAVNLRSGRTRSCGCLNGNKVDLTGQRFGRLVVLEMTNRKKGGNIIWKCRCDCGNECEAVSYNLRNGYINSCGCSRRGNVSRS